MDRVGRRPHGGIVGKDELQGRGLICIITLHICFRFIETWMVYVLLIVHLCGPCTRLAVLVRAWWRTWKHCRRTEVWSYFYSPSWRSGIPGSSPLLKGGDLIEAGKEPTRTSAFPGMLVPTRTSAFPGRKSRVNLRNPKTELVHVDPREFFTVERRRAH